MKQFARGVRGGILTTSMPSVVNTSSNVAVYLPSRSRIKNRNRPTRSPRSMTRLRACCTTQAVSRCGDAEQVYAAGGHLHHDQHVKPSEQDRVDVEEVDRQQPVGLGTQERSLTGVHRSRCRTEPPGGENAADRARANVMAQPHQLALDPPVPPPRVVVCQPSDQAADLVVDRWPAGLARVGPATVQQPPVPSQQGCRGDQPVGPHRRGQQPGQRGQDGLSGQDNRGRPFSCRRSTATSWRRARPSASNAVSLRTSRPGPPTNRIIIRYSNRINTPMIVTVNRKSQLTARATSSGTGHPRTANLGIRPPVCPELTLSCGTQAADMLRVAGVAGAEFDERLLTMT